jgi:hypothetical protein
MVPIDGMVVSAVVALCAIPALALLCNHLETHSSSTGKSKDNRKLEEDGGTEAAVSLRFPVVTAHSLGINYMIHVVRAFYYHSFFPWLILHSLILSYSR